MDKIVTTKTFFNIEDTLKCGQTFSFKQRQDGFLVRSQNKFAYLYYEGDNVVIETDEPLYFYNYFDLQQDYLLCYNYAKSFNIQILNVSAEFGKGIRILNQDAFETLFGFIISQNNNIARITKSINFLCENLGEYNQKYSDYTFPSVEKLANAPQGLLKSAGLGYRAEYVKGTAQKILSGEIDIERLKTLTNSQLKAELLKIKGVGEKVANCALLFGFSRKNFFPVDTWIEKVYLQDFKKEPTSRENMTKFFMQTFGEFGGIVQQYLFHYKRNYS